MGGSFLQKIKIIRKQKKKKKQEEKKIKKEKKKTSTHNNTRQNKRGGKPHQSNSPHPTRKTNKKSKHKCPNDKDKKMPLI